MMLRAYLYNGGGSIERVSFDPEQVESFTERPRVITGFNEDTVNIVMKTGAIHEICNRNGIALDIWRARNPE